MTKHFNKVMSRYNGDIMQVAELSEFIANRLYFLVLSDEQTPTTFQSFQDWKSSFNTKDIFYLNVDDELSYTPLNFDFGPFNLGNIYRYIGILRRKLCEFSKVVYCTHIRNQKRTSNAAFLIGAYMIIEENWTAHQAYAVLSQQYLYDYKPFRDASNINYSADTITVEECLNALYKAKWYGFFDFGDFDLFEYEYYSNPEFGGFNWILPNSLLAFSSPCSEDYVHTCSKQKNCTHLAHPPEFYFAYFNQNNVKHIVRLNSKLKYNAKSTFVAVANIKHSDMRFPDGTTPPGDILNSFLNLCEQYLDNDSVKDETKESNATQSSYGGINSDAVIPLAGSAVAVHCKAGLGRTGVLIAAYIIKHWSFTAHEAIAWIRICRPGSIFGVQQQWLVCFEENLQLAGRQWREHWGISFDRHKCYQNGVYSIRRHSEFGNTYEYVDEPPEVNYANYKQPSNSGSSSKTNFLRPKEYDQKMRPPPAICTLTTNNNVHDQKDDEVLDLSQKKSSTNDDTRLPKSPLSQDNNVQNQVKSNKVSESHGAELTTKSQ